MNARELYNSACADLRQKKWDEAKRKASEALALFQDSGDKSKVRGLISLAEKNYPRAVLHFTAAINHTTTNDKANCYSNRGFAYVMQRKYAEAIQDCNEAIRLNPNAATAYSMRGVAYVNQGSYAQAIQDYTEVIRLDPNNSTAYFNRGITYARQGNYTQAIQDYNEFIRFDPDDIDAHHCRSHAYFKLQNYTQAIQDDNEVIRLNPGDATAYLNRGAAYFRLGNDTQAIQDNSEAIRLNPDYALAHYNRGSAYTKQGKYEEAVKDFKKAIKLDPALKDRVAPSLEQAIPASHKLLQQRLDICYPDGLPVGVVSELAEKFYDPVRLVLMDDPRVLECGDSLDLVSLKDLEKNAINECPCCRAPITFTGRPPNNFLRSEIIAFVEEQERLVKNAEIKQEPEEKKIQQTVSDIEISSSPTPASLTKNTFLANVEKDAHDAKAKKQATVKDAAEISSSKFRNR